MQFTPSRQTSHIHCSLATTYAATRRRTLFTIAAIWLAAFATSAPFAWIAQLDTYESDSPYASGARTAANSGQGDGGGPVLQLVRAHRCLERMDDAAWKMPYLVAVVVLFFVVPLVVLGVVYAFIGRQVMRGGGVKQQAAQQLSPSEARARRQVVLMLVTVVSILSTSWLAAKLSILEREGVGEGHTFLKTSS